MILAPFAPISLTALHDDRLSAGAVRVLAVLLEHARKRAVCWPSQECIAEKARCSVRSVHTYTRQLVEAGYIGCRRRGRKITNFYVIYPAVAEETIDAPKSSDLQIVQPEPDEVKLDKRFDGSPPLSFASLPDHEQPCPEPIARLADDMSREMRDAAPVSTRTRLANIHAASGLSVEDFITEAIAARRITQQRLSRIRKRDRGGKTLPCAYWLAVVGQRANGTPRPQPPRPPVSLPPHTPHPELPRPPQPPVPRPPTPDRIEFWAAIREATGISDLHAYCRLTGRPPVYDDLRRSIGLAKERQRR